MAGWTNKGKLDALKVLHDGTSGPTNFYVHLVTDATVPGPASTTLGTFTEVSGGGYAAKQLAKNTTDFPVSANGTANDAYIQIKDLTWTASGGNIGTTANAIRYALLTDDNGTTAAARNVYYYWDLGSDKIVSDGDSLTLKQLQIDLNES